MKKTVYLKKSKFWKIILGMVISFYFLLIPISFNFEGLGYLFWMLTAVVILFIFLLFRGRNKRKQPYFEYDKDCFYYRYYNVKIPWSDVIKLDKIHLRAMETKMTIEFGDFNYCKENKDVLNYFFWFFKRNSSGSGGVLELNLEEIEGNSIKVYEEVKSLCLGKWKGNSAKDEIIFKNNKVYINLLKYLNPFVLISVFYPVFFFFIFLQDLDEGVYFLHSFYFYLILVVFITYVYRFYQFIKNKNIPFFELTKDNLLAKHNKYIIPWDEIISIEYHEKFEIHVTNKVNLGNVSNRIVRHFKSIKKTDKGFLLKIETTLLSKPHLVYREIIDYKELQNKNEEN